MRLIDADDLKNDVIYQTAFLSLFGGKIAEIAETLKKGILEEIEKAPTIDAVPVKHGEWIDPAAEDCYRCSVCEEYTHMEMPRLLYHYCPNCGAKMDGERKDMSGFVTRVEREKEEPFTVIFTTDDHSKYIHIENECRKMIDHEKPSNGDRIRAMTDEELAEWINQHDCHTNLYGYDPKDAILDWLKEEIDDENLRKL